MLRIIEAEATGGTVSQKMNVAWTILNRKNSKKFPNSIESVVFQKDWNEKKQKWVYQFSPIVDGRYYSVVITETTLEAWEKVKNGEGQHEALYFFNRAGSSPSNVSWFERKLDLLFDDGIHEYWVEK